MRILTCTLLAITASAAPKPKPKPIIEVATPVAKKIRMDERTIATIQTKIRYDTWIVFPVGEVVQKSGCGDCVAVDHPDSGGAWVMTPADPKHQTNVFHVKPAVAGMETNLHLLTNKGSYSFWVKEISKSCPACPPDVKVFIDPVYSDVPAVVDTSDEDRKRIGELETKVTGLEGDLTAAKREARNAKSEAEAAAEKRIAAFRRDFPANLRCDYQFKGNKEPFNVGAICTDGRFTYVESGSRGVEAIYEWKPDGVSLVQFTYERGRSNHEGVYVINGIVTRGYLQSGKKKRLKFGIKG